MNIKINFEDLEVNHLYCYECVDNNYHYKGVSKYFIVLKKFIRKESHLVRWYNGMGEIHYQALFSGFFREVKDIKEKTKLMLKGLL